MLLALKVSTQLKASFQILVGSVLAIFPKISSGLSRPDSTDLLKDTSEILISKDLYSN